MKKLVLNWNKEAQPYSDIALAELEQEIRTWRPIYLDRHDFQVNQTVVVDLFRALRKEGKLAYDELELAVNGKMYPIDENGRMEVWPTELEAPIRILERLL